MKRVLTIAGSDSGGGAGIQADLKTFSSLGVYGMSAITSITAQNTVGVQGIHDLPPEFVALQIDSVISDIGVDAAKTGMLSSSAIIDVVASKVKKYKIPNLVIDPVMYAKSGDPLLRPDARDTLINKLLPLSTLITPNISEAEFLSGIKIKGIEDMKKAGKKIKKRVGADVLVKGGHLRGKAVDILYTDGEFFIFESERIDTKNTHGTGCTYSAAIASELAKGYSLYDAVKSAKVFITDAIKNSIEIGKGKGPTNPIASLYRDTEKYRTLIEMESVIEKLKEAKIGILIPEVQSNMAVALSDAKGFDDVMAIPCRIIKYGNDIITVSRPNFGVSRHIASIVLTAIKFDPTKKAVMNIKYSPEIISACKKLNLKIGSFNRKDEPKKLKAKEGSSLEWGTEKAISESGFVPDIIYDTGDIGKEPIVRVIAENPEELSKKVISIKEYLIKK
ncbi:MAG: bifunctional hydroxymethylpyrimidine kinase/phosphomethylpyrimidine kinase [Nitrospinae bacterium RIFCSPLOWO2_12_39_16]|nr:MAG: bifunctional hydroxymethylpyrimidine kinase/phosphomethylpyrimidine kinase [Nitrospinae bacterium RIFCSPLOWO2_12_39_16]